MKCSIHPVFITTALLVTACGSQPEQQLPNIIFIMADDLGYNDLGCYGQELIKTPHIDDLATKGIRFTQHYAGSSVCAPSRGSLMTGLHTGNAYIKGNFAMEEEGNLPLPAETLTVAKILQNVGYKTAIVGKWGLGGPYDHGHPNNQGFDHSFCYLDQRLAHEYYPSHLWRNDEKVLLNNSGGKQNEYSHDLFTEEALTFIKQNKNNPFFLYLPYTIPHGKYQAPDLSSYSVENWEDRYKSYAAMITRMDSDVGSITALLDTLNIGKKTIIFFTSDNGAPAGVGKFFKSNHPFRGHKLEFYEGGIRVPMIVKWPGKIADNSTSNHVSAFWDFLPTVCELTGQNPPEGIDGISYLPALLGKPQAEHDYLYWEYFNYNYNWQPESAAPRNRLTSRAIRKGAMKGIQHVAAPSEQSRFELFNLENDIEEKNNLAEEYPEIVTEMISIMNSSRKDSEFFRTRD